MWKDEAKPTPVITDPKPRRRVAQAHQSWILQGNESVTPYLCLYSHDALCSIVNASDDRINWHTADGTKRPNHI